MIKFICFFLLLSVHLHAESKPKINLIWQCDRARILEPDWILELLSDFDVNEVCDGNFEVYMDNSIIVTGKSSEYFSKLKSMDYKFGVIHISDEVYACPTDFYEHALFVFRNYWHKKFTKEKKVSFLALGYKQGFWKSCSNTDIKPSSEREYTWSFAGQIASHPTRVQMIANMQIIPNYYFHQTFDFWDVNALRVSDYRDVLLKSIFVPCPTGYWNLDSFRVYEALECGCIPIVEKTPLNYFELFFGEVPFPCVSSWDEAQGLISALLNYPDEMEQIRKNCYAWWLNYKKEKRSEFSATIQECFFSKSI
jgi:hypothetical protein